ncbi:hypothetical protein ABT301_28300 [Streptomyces sp. NPDC000987]|uniref:hypothetical protein n=1 Tax=Streptomyces sp. NPDC000987 TaxID=3154374 RepID=UPI00331F7499
MKKRLALAALTVAMSLGMVGCSSGGGSEQGKLHGEADYEVYSSIEDLTTASTAAYKVKIGNEIGTECDDGGDAVGDGGEPTAGPEDSDPEDASPSPSVSPPPAGIEGGESEYADCLPMVFYKATILYEIYVGPTTLGTDPVDETEIIIGNVDTSKVNLEGASPLIPGSYVVIYGKQLSAAEHPGIQSIAEDVWTPVGGDQGLFDTDAESGTVTARSSEIQTLQNGASLQKAVPSGKFTTDIGSLKEVAESVTE